jgi:hypothetical protein
MPQAGRVTAQDYGSAQWLLLVRLPGPGQLPMLFLSDLDLSRPLALAMLQLSIRYSRIMVVHEN